MVVKWIKSLISDHKPNVSRGFLESIPTSRVKVFINLLKASVFTGQSVKTIRSFFPQYA